MVKKFKKDFSFSDLWVTGHNKASDFFLSSWQRGDSTTPLLAARFCLAAVCVGILIWSLVQSAGPHWMIYLTNWGLLLNASTMLCALFVSLMAKCTRLTSESEDLPWYMSMYWLFTNINVTCAILITTLYWSLLYGAEETDAAVFALDISTHALNSGIALSELAISRTPVKLLHIYQPLGVGLWYAAFSAIYYAAGGTNPAGEPFIYDVLDWREGNRAGAIVGMSAAGTLAIYCAVWILAKARDKLSETTARTTSQDLPFAPPLTPEPNRDARIA